MALQHIQHQPTDADAPASYFPVYGPAPIPTDRRTALHQTLTRQPFLVCLVTGFIFYCGYSFWAANGYWGGATINHWRCEILAGLLLSLTVWLYGKFRQWEQERVQRAARRQEYEEELAAFLQQAQATATATKQREFVVEIDAWKSERSAKIIEPDGSITELPDADLAPDMLVLKLQLSDRQ